jgi:hypothetical protein
MKQRYEVMDAGAVRQGTDGIGKTRKARASARLTDGLRVAGRWSFFNFHAFEYSTPHMQSGVIGVKIVEIFFRPVKPGDFDVFWQKCANM